MDEVTKQSVLSAVRSLLIMAGGSLATHGYINEGSVNEIVGSVMVILPVVWGIWNKFATEKKTVAREVTAVNAGIAAGTSGEVGETIRPADAPAIIQKFAPPTEGVKP
jgi:F0F1-type ATP synthase assembly protein I